jgi:hypothetical protein
LNSLQICLILGIFYEANFFRDKTGLHASKWKREKKGGCINKHLTFLQCVVTNVSSNKREQKGWTNEQQMEKRKDGK